MMKTDLIGGIASAYIGLHTQSELFTMISVVFFVVLLFNLVDGGFNELVGDL